MSEETKRNAKRKAWWDNREGAEEDAGVGSDVKTKTPIPNVIATSCQKIQAKIQKLQPALHYVTVQGTDKLCFLTKVSTDHSVYYAIQEEAIMNNPSRVWMTKDEEKIIFYFHKAKSILVCSATPPYDPFHVWLPRAMPDYKQHSVICVSASDDLIYAAPVFTDFVDVHTLDGKLHHSLQLQEHKVINAMALLGNVLWTAEKNVGIVGLDKNTGSALFYLGNSGGRVGMKSPVFGRTVKLFGDINFVVVQNRMVVYATDMNCVYLFDKQGKLIGDFQHNLYNLGSVMCIGDDTIIIRGGGKSEVFKLSYPLAMSFLAGLHPRAGKFSVLTRMSKHALFDRQLLRLFIRLAGVMRKPVHSSGGYSLYEQ